eukprot:CAMPEP_0114351292 /NCGR_PEP_ID=MMETSP0101-20121206/17068_1 /TAXON_ID=38822 ORGANISM="Pteridomonas danica, Strain PT" /NCGR_SAMPLE_ID=MMETSP0101 /ASSEMBLY_ACC=CAM_ASM_000211 /LENGTH=224 /DNA_ID=CAMNT_0001491083 /DNA_START=235 /DNA_END=906 /DNA_ORIENTATION=+
MNVTRFSALEVSLVSQMLSLLIESMQGPCAGNQELIIKSEIVSSLNFIIYAQNLNDRELCESDPSYMDLKSLSCILLSASLEGRHDDFVHIHLDRRLMKVALVEYKQDVETSLFKLTRLANHERRLPTVTENILFKTKQKALVAATTVLMELDHKIAVKDVDLTSSLVTSLATSSSLNNRSSNNIQTHDHQTSSNKLSNNNKKNSRNTSKASSASVIGVIEIAW